MGSWQNSSCRKFLNQHMKQYLPDMSNLRSDLQAIASSHERKTGAEKTDPAYEYWKTGQEI